MVFVIVLLAAMVSFAAVQALLVFLFARGLRRRLPSTSEVEIPVTVVLCVRGCDPSLDACVQRLSRLDYRNWQLVVVGDHPEDPALSQLQSHLPDDLRQRTRFHVVGPSDRFDTCSLKCNSLISACQELDAQTEVVALLDADTRPTQHWLSRLVAPFQDDQVGAVTGIRWYQPQDANWGSWVRYVWNAAAIVQMWFYRIPWGGSLAIRRRFLDDAHLLNVWQTTFCEDTPLPEVLNRLGYRLDFATDLIVTNHESCQWRGLSRWVGRQLLTTRLHHASWGCVLGHAVLSVSLMILGLVGVVVYALQREWMSASFILGGMFLYQAVMVGLVYQIGRAVKIQVDGVGVAGETRSKGVFGLLAAIVLSQLTYAAGAWFACWSTRVQWRGIDYQIGPKRSVRRLNYLPMIEVERQKNEYSID